MAIKTDVPGISKERDGVLINIDNSALNAYKKSKIQSQKIIELECNMDQLKTDMLEIKELLRGLLK